MANPSDIIAAAKIPRKKGRSEVFWWLWKHYATVRDDIEAGANWSEIAAKFAASGLRDGNGNPPAPRTVADTWRKVVQLKQHGPKKRRVTKRSKASREFRRAARKR